MDKFIHRENLKHYKNLLLRTTDESERQRILTLIEEEENKFRKTSVPTIKIVDVSPNQKDWCHENGFL